MHGIMTGGRQHRRENSVLIAALVFLWGLSALLPIVPSVALRAIDELRLVRVPDFWVLPLMWGSMSLDAVLGVLLWRFHDRAWVWWLQIAVVVSYSCILTVSHPQLWLDPFGALSKNIPILAVMVYMLRTHCTSIQR